MVSEVLVYSEAEHRDMMQSGEVKPLALRHEKRKADSARGRDLALLTY